MYPINNGPYYYLTNKDLRESEYKDEHGKIIDIKDDLIGQFENLYISNSEEIYNYGENEKYQLTRVVDIENIDFVKLRELHKAWYYPKDGKPKLQYVPEQLSLDYASKDYDTKIKNEYLKKILEAARKKIQIIYHRK